MSGSAEAGKAFIRLVVKDQTRYALRNAMRRFRMMSMSLRKSKIGFTTVALAAGLARKALNGVAAAAVAAGIGLAAIAATGVIISAKSIKAAADMQETMNAFNETFRQNAVEVSAWAAKFSSAVGRSRQESLEALTSFQAFMVGLGLGPAHSKDMSKSLVRLSADFASFRNLTDEEAVQRFMSALAGEPERLRRFGVNIGEAAVNLQLMAMGFPRVQEGATELQKVMARYQIILETLGRQNAIGDAIRTASSFINQIKRMKGTIDELRFSLGNALLPAMTEVIRVTNIWLDGFVEKSDALGDFAQPLADSVGEWMAILEAGASNWELVFETVAVKIKMIFAQLFLDLAEGFLQMIEGIKSGIADVWKSKDAGRGFSNKTTPKFVSGFMAHVGTMAAEAMYGSTAYGERPIFKRSMAAGRGFAKEWHGSGPSKETSWLADIKDWSASLGEAIVGGIPDLEERQRELSALWGKEVERIRREHAVHEQERKDKQKNVQDEPFFDPNSVTSGGFTTVKQVKGGAGTAQLSSAVGLLSRDMQGEVREQTKQLKKANGHLANLAAAAGGGLGN